MWAGARLALLLLGLTVFWRGAIYGPHLSEEQDQQEELGELATAAAAAAARALSGEPPALHGLVAKSGQLHESRWHPRHTDYINHKWGVWMKKRRAASRRARQPSVLSPHVFPGCAVLAVSSLLQTPLHVLQLLLRMSSVCDGYAYGKLPAQCACGKVMRCDRTASCLPVR